MSHSQKHYGMFGKIVEGAKKGKRDELHRQYFTMIMDGLRFLNTVKKNTNVLQHMSGHFKELLSKDEKQELREAIEHYRQELVPLIVPLTLIKHYVRKYDVEYLKRQYYLNPHPLELMLRNHV